MGSLKNRKKIGIAAVLAVCVLIAVALISLQVKGNKEFPRNLTKKKITPVLQQEQFEMLKKEYAGLTFVEDPHRCSEIPAELENILGEALINGTIQEFVDENEISCQVLSVDEQRNCAEKDSAGVLKEFLSNDPANADLWFIFPDTSTIFIRQPLEDGKYAYYGFWVNKETKSFSYLPAMRALGLEPDYFFIRYEEKEYLITTKRDEKEIIGLATYYMHGKAVYGGVFYQEKTGQGSLVTKYWGYTTYGEKHAATYWPEY